MPYPVFFPPGRTEDQVDLHTAQLPVPPTQAAHVLRRCFSKAGSKTEQLETTKQRSRTLMSLPVVWAEKVGPAQNSSSCAQHWTDVVTPPQGFSFYTFENSYLQVI